MAFAATRSFGPLGGLVSRDPFREFARFQRALSPQVEARGLFVPQIDAVEDEDAFRITAEVAGVDEADLSVEIEDGVLTLKGEKRSYYEASTPEAAEAVASDSDIEAASAGVEPAVASRFHRSETRYGRFERRFRFNADVDEENVTASYRNGVLHIVVPKVDEEVPAARTIPVQAG